MPQPSWLVTIGWSPETTWGTAVNPATNFFSCMTPTFKEVQDVILDQGFRGLRSQNQALTFGAAHSEIAIPDTPFYPADSGWLLMSIMGADAPTGAGPFTHTMTVLNTGLPKSYTVAKYDALVATARQVAGCYTESVTLKYANPGKLTIGATMRGKFGIEAAKSTAAYDAAPFYAPWMGALTLNGVSNARMISGEIDIKAPAPQVFGMNNTQSPTAAVADQLTINGKLTFIPDDRTEFLLYTANTQGAFSLVFTNGANTFTIQMTKCAITVADYTHPKITQLDCTFEGIANSTDAGTGNAPFKCILVNAKAGAYV